MLRIRRTVPLTWFSVDGSRILAARLAERACNRLRKGGLFLTLTYDRSKYADARELYDEARDQRHVRRFVHRLERLLGASLKGKWLRKMEFHEGPEGWLHWHVLLDWRSSIPHDVLTKAWGHGHVWVGKATRSRIRYTCKYVAKTLDDLPGWLLAEPARSVKIVAVSPGFWDEGDVEPEVKDQDVDDGGGVAGFSRLPTYVTIGQALERNRDAVEVVHYDTRFGEVDVECYRFRLNLAQVYLVLEAHGSSLHDDGDGWFSACCPDDPYELINDLRSVEWAAWEGASEGGGSRPDAPSLHSTDTQDAPISSWVLRLIEWSDGVEWCDLSERRAA